MSARVVRVEHTGSGDLRVTASLTDCTRVCSMFCLTTTTSLVVGMGIYLAVQGQTAAVALSICALIIYITAAAIILRTRLLDVHKDVLVVHQLVWATRIPVTDVRNVEVRRLGRGDHGLSIHTSTGQNICSAMGGDKTSLEEVAVKVRVALLRSDIFFPPNANVTAETKDLEPSNFERILI